MNGFILVKFLDGMILKNRHFKTSSNQEIHIYLRTAELLFFPPMQDAKNHGLDLMTVPYCSSPASKPYLCLPGSVCCVSPQPVCRKAMRQDITVLLLLQQSRRTNWSQKISLSSTRRPKRRLEGHSRGTAE